MVNDIRERFKKVIAQTLEIQPENINLEAKLQDLGANSYYYLRIVVALEDEFGFEFSDDQLDYEKFETVMEIVNYVEKQIQND